MVRGGFMGKSACLLVALTTSFAVCAQQPASPGAATPQAPASQASAPAGSGAATAPAEAPPEHPITAAQVHELMDLTGMTNLQKQMLEGFMPSLRQMMPPYIPADVMDDFQKSLLGADMDSLVVRVYQKHLSTEDAEQVIAFYKIPAGKRVLAIMPAVLKETQEGGAQLGEQVMLDVVQRHKAEIDAAKQKYEQQHPPASHNQ
jgi:hypothetical protein